MRYRLATLCMLCAWSAYSLRIGFGLALICGLTAIFYAGALRGPAEEKVYKAMAIIAIVVSCLMFASLSSQSGYDDADGVRYCASVQC